MNIKNILNVVLLFVLSLGMAGCSDSEVMVEEKLMLL